MNYEINEGTLAIVPEKNNESRVFEDENEYIIKQKSFDIMDDSCKYFGSSYNGRKIGTKSILGIEYKVPIIVEDSKNIIFFPTTSPQDESCMWISVNQIKNYRKTEYNQTEIIFKNNKRIIIPMSFRSIENQILRATRLESIIRNRKNTTNSYE